MRAGDLLQFDDVGRLTGLLEDWMARSRELAHPIKVVVLESNSSFKHLTQYAHFKAWRQKWRVGIIEHKTQSNRADLQTGVEALLPAAYRQGLVRIPRSRLDMEAWRFSEDFKKELTQWPDGATTDLVMAQWFGLWNIARIVASSSPPMEADFGGKRLPPYLERQRREVPA